MQDILATIEGALTEAESWYAKTGGLGPRGTVEVVLYAEEAERLIKHLLETIAERNN